jgi:hypothetical protein
MEHEPFTTIDAAVAAVESFDGRPEDFVLAISDTLQDPFGVSIAIITDKALAKGWWPDGFEQCVGFRRYRYKALP